MARKTKAKKSEKPAGFLAKLDKLNLTLQKPKALLSILLIIVAGFFTIRFLVNTYQANQEKKELLSQHQELEKFTDNVSKKNKPDGRESKYYCDYSNIKFEKGVLSCLTLVRLTYKKVTTEEANRIMTESVGVIGNGAQLKESGYPNSSNTKFSDSLIKSGRDSFYIKHNQSDFNCSTNFVLENNEVNAKDFIITSSCLKSPAKAEHFPVEK